MTPPLQPLRIPAGWTVAFHDLREVDATPEAIAAMMTAGILHDQTIAPGRKIRGALYFQTATGEARAKQLTLHFGKTAMTLVNAGFLTDEELKAHDAFRD